MNNLSNTARKLDKIFSIVHIVLGALAIACLVLAVLSGAGYVFKWDPESIGTFRTAFELDFIELQVADAYCPDKLLILVQIAITLFVGAFFLYDSRRGVGYIREILHPMIEEKPFDSTASLNLGKLAKLSIRLGILYNIIYLAQQIIAISVYNLPELLISEKISHVATMFKVDLSFLIYWAILTLLSYVFQHGAQLQQLSDETL